MLISLKSHKIFSAIVFEFNYFLVYIKYIFIYYDPFFFVSPSTFFTMINHFSAFFFLLGVQILLEVDPIYKAAYNNYKRF